MPNAIPIPIMAKQAAETAYSIPFLINVLESAANTYRNL